MKFVMLKKKKILFPAIGLLVLVLTTVLIIFNWQNGSKETPKKEKKSIYYQALKIDGKYVTEDFFKKEEAIFYKTYKSNAEYLRMADDERENRFFDQVIERSLVEWYVKKHAAKKVTKNEIKKYIEEKIISTFPNKDKNYLKPYLAEKGLSDEKALEREVEFYLLRLNSLPGIAKKYGLKLNEDEQKKVDNKEATEDNVLLNKFMGSKELKTWIKKVKKDVKIEIKAPTILAYRYMVKKDYKKAAKYYRIAYKKSNFKGHLDKAKECEKQLNK